MNMVEDGETHAGASCRYSRGLRYSCSSLKTNESQSVGVSVWQSFVTARKPHSVSHMKGATACKAYLLVHYGAHQVLDSGQRQVTGLQVHRLSGQSDLQQEGHPVERVGGAVDAVSAVGQPSVERPGRRRGRLVRIESVEEGSR